MSTSHTLVLTPYMSLHRVCSWFDGVCLVYTGKVDILEEYEETVSSPSVTMQVPAVVRLRKVVSTHKKGVKFSRINVFTRDGFRCQYCGRRFPTSELSIDHVIPRSLGGRSLWDNVVCACVACNVRKGGRLPQEAGMRLTKKPVRPPHSPVVHLKLGNPKYQSWKTFLDNAYWDVELK